ncbi:hypothetical protein GOODEAATRI_002666 [Goodea atripinnis]|uniref:Uncharacterized protein n=1 Tax=Goodea atripinnis TaxID=208336 RepID=A0ABV0MNS5_9TELE
METMSWIALRQQAIPTKLGWDTDRARIQFNKKFFTQMCPDWLERSLDYGRSSLLRTAPEEDVDKSEKLNPET